MRLRTSPARNLFALVASDGDDDVVARWTRRFVERHGDARVTTARMEDDGDGAAPSGRGLSARADGALLVPRRDLVDRALEEAARAGADLIVAAEAGRDTRRLIRRSSMSLVVLPRGGALPRGPALALADFTPESVRSARLAVDWAEDEDIDVEVLHLHPVGDDLSETLRATVRRRMDWFADVVGGNGRATYLVEPAAIGGYPAQTVVARLRARQYSHVFVGSRRRSSLVAVLFGSVAEEIALAAQIPVWIVQHGTALRLREALREEWT